jgi:hypothetical protein
VADFWNPTGSGCAGSVRVFPDEHRADRYLLLVIETDPHTAPNPWPGSSVTSIAQRGMVKLSDYAHRWIIE